MEDNSQLAFHTVRDLQNYILTEHRNGTLALPVTALLGIETSTFNSGSRSGLQQALRMQGLPGIEVAFSPGAPPITVTISQGSTNRRM